MEELQVEYKRDMQSSYLVIRTEEIPENTYRILMLLNNRIEGLLEMELRSIDDKNVYYYEISSRQSFACLYEKRTLTCAELRNFIRNLISIINRGKEYLLEEDDFVIRPEYIYMSPPACELSLCYLPGYRHSMRNQLSELFEVLMNKVNYKEERAVLLIYALYMASREEGCTFEKLLDLIREQSAEEAWNPDLEDCETDRIKTETKKREEALPGQEEKGVRSVQHKGPAREREQSKKGEEGAAFSDNPMFLSDAERRKYRIAGIAGIMIAIVLAIYIAGEGIRGDMNAARLTVGAGLAIAAAAASIYAFYLSAQRRSPRIQPLKLNVEATLKNAESRAGTKEHAGRIRTDGVNWDEKEEESIRNARTDEAHFENGAKEINGSAEKGAVKRELPDPSSEWGQSERTVMLSDFTKEEYYLTPAGRHTDEKILLEEFPYYIGKWREHVNLLLEDSSVSRFHAKITKEGEDYYITDLNSTNGTFVNRDRLQPNEKRRLNTGDEVAFAGRKYQFLSM
ncbi:MAG: FHA domain-containing protein [Lachnospiraceae bacterium]|nr:FHA domain-containing protein [Lachnospiraceae bacterium]